MKERDGGVSCEYAVWTVDKVLEVLKSRSSIRRREGAESFGINAQNSLGVSVPEIRKLSTLIGRNHDLAAALWSTGIHEARLLSPMIADPVELSEKQMERFVSEIKSWDICDNICGELFRNSPLAEKKIYQLAGRE